MRLSVTRLLLLALTSPLVGTPVIRPGCGAPLPDAAKTPERSLYQLDGAWTGNDGAPFRLSQLRGHTVVMAMIFTGCASACPLIVEEMKQLERALPASLSGQTHFVLVTFDSNGDTPQVLEAYRKRTRLDAGRWILLNGKPDQVRELAMALGVSYSEAGPGLFTHSSLVSILNRRGEIIFQRSSLQGANADAIRVMSTNP